MSLRRSVIGVYSIVLDYGDIVKLFHNVGNAAYVIGADGRSSSARLAME